MKVGGILSSLVVLCLFAGRCAGGLPAGVPLPPLSPPAPPSDTREALVFGALRFYKSAEHNRQGYEQLIDGLRARGVAVYPRVVLGSYLDLVDWITRGRIDLAWLPPLSYLSAKKTQPGIKPLATVLRRDGKGGLTDSTMSLLVTRKGEMPRTLKELARRRIVFGAELSTSGFLLPLHFLRINGVNVPQPYHYAGSQQQAVEKLLGGELDPTSADVIGVSELTVNGLPPGVAEKLDTLAVAEDGVPLRIPNDAIVARAGLPDATLERVKSALLGLGEGKPGLAPDFFHSELGVVGFREFDPTSYKSVEKILATGILRGDRYSIKAVLDSIRWKVELETDLAQLEGRRYTPRIALVLSGGGAAGCYQAGAAMEVCRTMSELGMKPDIVVGTSVGAINATAVAMGRADVLERFWSAVSLDTVLSVREEDQPLGVWKLHLIKLAQRAPALLAMAMFLFLAYLEVLLFTWALRPLELSGPKGLGIIGAIGAICMAMEGRLPGPTMVTLAALVVAHGLLVSGRRRPGRTRLRVWMWRVHALVLVLVLMLGPAQLHRAFSDREAAFSTDGLFRTLAKFFLDLRHLPVPENDRDLKTAVSSASRALLDEGLAHTLVISTTDYHRQIGRTFFVTSDPDIKRRGLERGYTSIPDACPDQLLDAVTASAAVFPVLEPRTVTLRNGEQLRLIDGGFVHNNPVQIAVDLGATHVLIIKPSADQDFIEGDPSLLSSLFSFFGWLIARSQTEDLAAKDEVMSFLIGPLHDKETPVIGPLEFDGHFAGGFGLTDEPQLSLKGFLDVGRSAARSPERGFQLWSRGTFKLPPK